MKGYVHRTELVVATQHEHLVGEHDLLSEQVGQYLDGVLPAIDVVAKKQEASRSQVHSERPQQLREGDKVGHVSMEVAEHVNGRLEFQNSGLGAENVFYSISG